MEFKTSKYIVITDTIDNKNHLIYSTRTNTGFLIKNDVLHSLEKQQWHNIPNETKFRLMDANIIVPEKENELDIVMKRFEGFKNEDTFGLTIQPSGNCQLGCGYCGQQHSKLEMSDETFNNTLLHVNEKFDTGNYKNFLVTWYGAEPLMSLSNIHRLSKEFLKICKDRKMNFRANMITNGMSLKPKIFELLARDYHIREYQITLDGDQEYHDNSRFTKKGLPTFDIIYNNIKSCVQSPVYSETSSLIVVRCNITKESSKGIERLFRKIAQDGFQDKIIIDLAPVHDWGGNNANTKGFSKQEFADMEIDWIILMKELGFKMNPLLPTKRSNTCMVTSGENAELIDAFGNLTYCWETTYTPKYSESDFIIGNVNKTEVYRMGYENAPLKNWYELIRQGFSWCKDCTFLPVCGGACPVAWDKKEPPCPSFKYNFQERLVLDYLEGRIKKQQLMSNSN